MNLRHRLLFPMLIEIFHSHESSRVHPVDVERAVEVIDFMLEDASIPAACFNYFGLALVVQTIYAYAPGPRDDGGEASQAQTAFEKLDTLILQGDSRIDDHLEWNGRSFALLQDLRISVLDILRLVFDNRNLQSSPDLRCRQSDTGCFVHRLSHTLDETLNFTAPNFVYTQAFGPLTQNRLTCLDDTEWHVRM